MVVLESESFSSLVCLSRSFIRCGKGTPARIMISRMDKPSLARSTCAAAYIRPSICSFLKIPTKPIRLEEPTVTPVRIVKTYKTYPQTYAFPAHACGYSLWIYSQISKSRNDIQYMARVTTDSAVLVQGIQLLAGAGSCLLSFHLAHTNLIPL